MVGDVIRIEAKHNFTMFPRKPKVLGKGGDMFGIVSWTVTDVLEGDPQTDAFDCVTVVGEYNGEIDPNKTYTILGKEITHEKYGVQYELMFVGEIIDFTSVGNQKAFLKTFLTDGQIEEMFKVLDNPLQSIQNHDVEALKKVHGIGDYISERIIERFEECKDYCNVYMELDEWGLTPKFIQRLIKEYNNPNTVINIVKNDPYRLCFEVEGIGFKTADKIALGNNMSPRSKDRIEAYIHYLLEDLAQMGDSYILAYELTDYIFSELGDKEEILEEYYNEDGLVVGNNIGDAVKGLIERGVLVVEESEKVDKSNRRVYLKKYYNLEKRIANHLKRITNAENEFEFGDWKGVIDLQEKEQGWEFTEEQLEGIEACLNNQVVFITGGAGTGKSSVLGGVLQALECYKGKYSFAQTSLSGKAASRMQEITGQEGYTIHRLLKLNRGGFDYNIKNPLPYDIVILDEVSLVGGEIFLSLIEAIHSGSKLIILGDLGQLESIGSLNLAHDLYSSDFIKTVELTKIHRQAAKSGIITASKSVREGNEIFKRTFQGQLTVGELEDMHFDVASDKESTRERALKHFKEYWNSGVVKDVMDIQVLAAVRERGDASVFNLNQDIQKIVNPYSKLRREIEISIGKNKSYILREGDKIMNMKNNYQTINIEGAITPIFNGWRGVLVKIDCVMDMATIYFPIIKESVFLPLRSLRDYVELGYASTVHKEQGSSAEIIIGVLDHSVPPFMRTKELAYTLITRAEKECVFVVQNKAFDDAIRNSGVLNKNTFLVELLDS